MYFLKCNDCGHFNDVKTEYMTLCSKCGKKLDNNYPDWSKRNPDKSFDDYKQLVCCTEIVEEKKKKKSLFGGKKEKQFMIAFVIVFFTSSILSLFLSDTISMLWRRPMLDKIMLELISEINSGCSVYVDNMTRLDNVTILTDRGIQYNYTLNCAKDSIVDIGMIKDAITPRVINTIKTSPNIKALRDYEVTFKYYCSDAYGVYLFSIIVEPEQYKN